VGNLDFRRSGQGMERLWSEPLRTGNGTKISERGNSFPVCLLGGRINYTQLLFVGFAFSIRQVKFCKSAGKLRELFLQIIVGFELIQPLEEQFRR
jgi:hypothetical protein